MALSLDHPIARRWYLPLAVGLTVSVLIVFVPLSIVRVWAFIEDGSVAIDYDTHLAFARRWLDTGSMYLPYQLAGPFDPRPSPHVPGAVPSMYPPHALYLFAPFLVLPPVLWWLIPLGTVTACLWRWRIAPWSWPIVAGIAASVDVVSSVTVGNTSMWIMAFVAAGLAWGWPAILVTVKPSLLPFALIGITHRSWWMAAVVLVVVSAPLLGQWVAYVEVVRNVETSPAYSLDTVPALLLPVVAWYARRRPPRGQEPTR